MAPDLAFPLEEYDGRIARTREKMAERGLDVLLLVNPVSTKYLTGYQTSSVGNYQCLVLPRHGSPSILVWELERPGVALTSWLDDVAVYRTGEDRARATRRLLHEGGLAGGVIGIERDSRYVTAQDHEQLAGALKGCRTADGSGLVKSLLRHKSPREVACLREAGRFTAAGLRAAVETAAAGVTDNEVAAAAHRAMIGAGSEFPCLSPVVTSGRRSGIPHTTHQRTRIEPGDTVLLELGGVFQRYTAPLMRTVFVGRPPAGADTVAEATLAALETVMATLRPGITAETVAEAAAKLLPLDDPSIVFHHTYGYSVGLGFPPSWADDGSLTLIAGNAVRLEPGMVFHSTMSLRCRERYGVAVSETLLVTETGCEPLTEFPRRYFQV